MFMILLVLCHKLLPSYHNLSADTFAFIIYQSGLTGNIFSQISLEASVLAVGASGSVFGLIGALMIHQLVLSGGFFKMMEQPIGMSILIILFLNLVSGQFIQNIDSNAHLGGLMFGIGLGFWFFTGSLSSIFKDNEKFKRIIMYRRLLFFLLAFLLAYGLVFFIMPSQQNQFQKAQHFLVQGEFEEARKIYQELIDQKVSSTIKGNDIPALINISRLQTFTGDIAGSAKTLELILENLPDPTKEKENPEQLSLFQKNIRMFQFLFQELPAQSISKLQIQSLLAECYHNLNQKENLSQLLTPFVDSEIEEGSLEYYKVAIFLLNQAGEQEAARKLADKLIAKYSRNKALIITRMDLYLNLPNPDFQQAILLALEYQKQNEGDPYGTYLEALVHLNFCDYEKANELFELASTPAEESSRNPLATRPEYWFHHGICLLRLGKFESAIDKLLRARNMVSKDQNFYMDQFELEHSLNRAFHYSLQQEKEQIFRDNYLKSLEENTPFNLTWMGKNAIAYFMSVTEHDIEKALELALDSISAVEVSANLDTLAWVYFQNKNYPEALETMQKSISLAMVVSPEMYFHLGMILSKMNRKEEALTAFESALNTKIDFPERHLILHQMDLLKNGKAPVILTNPK